MTNLWQNCIWNNQDLLIVLVDHVDLVDHCGRIQKFRETGNLKHLYRDELDKACFACFDLAHSDSKDLVKKTISDKILKDRVYENARNRKYDGYQRALATLRKKWSFPLRVSSVNVTKSAVSCGFGHIYWKNPWWKLLFFVLCKYGLKVFWWENKIRSHSNKQRMSECKWKTSWRIT